MKNIFFVVLAIVVVLVLFKFVFKLALGLVGLAAFAYLVYYFTGSSQKRLPK